MTRREVPQWVMDEFANRSVFDPVLYGTGLVLMRDGEVIDRWDFRRRSTGFWRDAGLGVEQWVESR